MYMAFSQVQAKVIDLPLPYIHTKKFRNTINKTHATSLARRFSLQLNVLLILRCFILDQ